jgi:hypothetical protein
MYSSCISRRRDTRDRTKGRASQTPSTETLVRSASHLPQRSFVLLQSSLQHELYEPCGQALPEKLHSPPPLGKLNITSQRMDGGVRRACARNFTLWARGTLR